MMASENKERTTDVIHLELRKAFDVAPHHILNLGTYRFEEWTIRWQNSWLDDHRELSVALVALYAGGGQL